MIKLTYRDALGEVVVWVNEWGIDFSDGYAFFTVGEEDYKIPMENLISAKA